MDSLTDRLTRSLAQRGIWGTISLCAVTAGWKVLPNFRRFEKQKLEADLAFDQTYGVETGGTFRPKKDEVIGENWALGGNYEAILPSHFDKAIKSVHIPYEDFAFVDIGSGKGRCVLMASMFPFKKVVGVEYCPALNEVARRNMQIFPDSEKRCKDIEILDADATQFQFPEGPFLLFMNNPFAEPVMAPVVRNFAQSWKSNPRRVVVIYFWPALPHLWEQTGIFKKLQDAPAIFETNGSSPSH